MFFDKPSAVAVGDAAPPFALTAQDGRKVKLVDFRGRQRVVVAFFPEADTAGWVNEMQAFEAHLARFQACRTQVLGVSHNTVDQLARFAEKRGLSFPLLADPAAEAGKPYGVKGILPFFSRRAFVIDGQGVLRMVVNGQPNMEQLLTYLSALNGDLPG